MNRATLHTPVRGLTIRNSVWIFLGAILVGSLLYSPALHGRFVFDDDTLPFRQGIRNGSLAAWVTGVRPVLMFTYWVNYNLSGENPYSYHFLNLFIHAANSFLVFLILIHVLALGGWPERKRYAGAALGATVFLVHPLATESVSYIAGRSESLAGFFMLAAYIVFLDARPMAITWRRSILVVTLFALAVATKENAIALAGVLLLTDLMWPKPFSFEGVRRNYRVYLTMSAAIPIAAMWVYHILSGAETAGFSIKGFTWTQYAFTEGRAIFEYIRLAVFPIGQSVDHDFAVSQSITSYGAVYFLALLAGLLAAAVLWRARYPLGCFGLLLFLVLLAPTSSVVPIADPLVERRLYLPILGLILIGCQAAAHARWSASLISAALAMLILYSALCYERNHLWSKPEQVWAAAARDSRTKGRPYLGLAESLIAVNRCAEAIPYLERGEQLMPRDFGIQLAWGKILECQGKREQALARLERAAAIVPNSAVYQLIGLLYGEMGRTGEAGAALLKAALLGPRNANAHSALGIWYESVGNTVEAEREYRESLAIYPYSTEALAGLDRVQRFAASHRPLPTTP